MKNKRYIILVVFSVLCLGVVKVYFNHQKKKTPQIKTLMTQPRESMTSASLARTSATDPKSENPEEVDASCVEFYSLVQQLDLEQLNFPPKITQLPALPKDCKKFPQALTLVQENFQKNCSELIGGVSDSIDEKEWTKINEKCVTPLYFLRSAITAWHMKGTPLSEITDLRILTDLLANAFTQTVSEGMPNFPAVVAIGERMLEVDPKIYGAAKAVAMGDAIQGFADPKLKESPDYWEKLSADVARASELNLNENKADSELPALDLISKTKGFDPELLLAETNSKLKSHPESAADHHLQGYALWKLNRRPEATAALAKALQLDPKNTEYNASWKAIHASGADESAYKGTISFQLSFTSILD